LFYHKSAIFYELPEYNVKLILYIVLKIAIIGILHFFLPTNDLKSRTFKVKKPPTTESSIDLSGCFDFISKTKIQPSKKIGGDFFRMDIGCNV
jgi:hypothetical protein